MVSWRSDIIAARMCLLQSSSVRNTPPSRPPCKDEQTKDVSDASDCNFVLFSDGFTSREYQLSPSGFHLSVVRQSQRCLPPQRNERSATFCLPHPSGWAAVRQRPAAGTDLGRLAVTESAISAPLAHRPPRSRSGDGGSYTDRQDSVCAAAGVDRLQTLRYGGVEGAYTESAHQ